MMFILFHILIISLIKSSLEKWFRNHRNKQRANTISNFWVESIDCSHTGAKCPLWSLVGKNRDNIIGSSIPFKRSQKSAFFPSPFFDYEVLLK